MELRNASFLEASRRSSKEGRAGSPEEYKGAQDAKSCVVVSSGGLLLGRDLRLVVFLVACLWRSGPWSDPFVGARSRWGVRALAPGTRTGGAALPAVSPEPACPCKERRRELAGPVEGPSQPRLSGLPWQQTSRLVHRGTSRVQVTCNGLVGPFRSPRLHVITVYGPLLTPLSLRVVFSFLLNECWWRRL